MLKDWLLLQGFYDDTTVRPFTFAAPEVGITASLGFMQNIMLCQSARVYRKCL